MRKKEQYLKEIYDIDPTSSAYIIEVALDDFTDIFNEWDPAPFKRRDLDPDLEEYLLSAVAEIPSKESIKLCFIMSPGKYNVEKEAEALAGLKNSFIYKRYQLKKQLGKNNSFAIRYLLSGFLFLWLSTVIPNYLAVVIASSLLSEGIFIGGWVFIWQAFNQIFFHNRELYIQHKYVKLLQLAPVVFRKK